MKYFRHVILVVLLAFVQFTTMAEYTFETGAEVNLGAGSGDFTPFYIHSNRHGKITQANNAQLELWAQDTLSLSKRFDFAWGLDVVGGYASKVDYRRWNPDTHEFYNNPQGPAPVWIQQLYGEVKWRCLYLSLGLKDRNSCFVDQELSSGDLLWSGNSRGIPEARIGFVDFQNIPFTNKWVQIDACISYGKFIDTDWINNHFDYYSGKRNPGSFWTYKRIALRSNPEKPFMLQFGFQMSGLFGGWTYFYSKGEYNTKHNNYGGFKDFFLMILPINFDNGNGEGYKVGDHKGTWDVAARYRFKNGSSLRAYAQWLWEDGSGLLKQNGWDGLWGLEWKAGRRWWIDGAAVEYLDLTHMGGPLSYAPGFNNTGGANIPYPAHGRDSYYNNFYYRSYVNYGLNMGTPMVQGILFNTGDNPDLINNDLIPYFRVRGFHVAVKGSILPNLEYMVKYSHRKAWGDTNSYTLIHPTHADCFLLQAFYRMKRVPGLALNAAVGLDRGTLPGNSFGVMVGGTYSLPINLGRK